MLLFGSPVRHSLICGVGLVVLYVATAGRGHPNTAFGDVDEQIQLGILPKKIGRSGAGIVTD